MSDESSNQTNPYDQVLADLRAKRDEIDSIIKVLERYAIPGGLSIPAVITPATGGEIPHDYFHGLSISDAAKKVLQFRKRDLGNKQIVADFKAGGLVMASKNPENTINAVLYRRFNDVGDIVRVGRGIWGLKEWHPTIRAPKGNDRKEEKEGDA